MSQQYDGINIDIDNILDCFDNGNPLAKDILDRVLSLQVSIERKEEERKQKIVQVKAQITAKLRTLQDVNTPNFVDNMITQRTVEPLERMHSAIGEAIVTMNEVC